MQRASGKLMLCVGVPLGPHAHPMHRRQRRYETTAHTQGRLRFSQAPTCIDISKDNTCAMHTNTEMAKALYATGMPELWSPNDLTCVDNERGVQPTQTA